MYALKCGFSSVVTVNLICKSLKEPGRVERNNFAVFCSVFFVFGFFAPLQSLVKLIPLPVCIHFKV
jgi:hypothetical protein